MNFDVICRYIQVFNMSVWVLTFYVVLYISELLTFWCVAYIVISTLVPRTIQVVYAACGSI
jgi:hypothetical protein